MCRGGSKGIPKKNIKLLNGRPLMSYVIEELKKLPFPIYVSTDDQEIADVAKGLGVQVIDRPSELATDTAKSIDAVKHALPIMNADYVLLANACTPFVKAEDYEGTVKMLETGCDSVTSLVEDFSAHPSKVCRLEENSKVIPADNEGGKPKFETGERQLLGKCFKRNTAIYLSKREVIESGTFFGSDTRGYVMPKERSWDINDEFDWSVAEYLIKKQNGTT